MFLLSGVASKSFRHKKELDKKVLFLTCYMIECLSFFASQSGPMLTKINVSV